MSLFLYLPGHFEKRNSTTAVIVPLCRKGLALDAIKEKTVKKTSIVQLSLVNPVAIRKYAF